MNDLTYRNMSLRVTARDEATDDDGRIPIALSSETPVERWDWMTGDRYLEVLAHTKDAMDLSEVRDGVPFLLDHDTREQIGIVEDITMDSDGTMRGLARFSRSQRAQEVATDMLDGIRKSISIGYRIDQDSVEERGPTKKGRGAASKLPTRYVKSWRLYEASSVAIPADPTVGVNRSADRDALRAVPPVTNAAPKAEGVQMSETTPAAPGNGVAVAITQDHAGETRAKELVALAREVGMEDQALTWISEGTSIESARREVMHTLSQRLKDGPKFAPRVELSEAEHQQYSFARAILSASTGEKSFERDISEQIARSLPTGYKTQGSGFFVPTNVQHRVAKGMTGDKLIQRSGLDAITSTKGSETVFDVPGSFIDLLRNKAVALRAGATMMAGLSSPVTMPKQTGAITAYWWAENHTAAVTVSEATLGTVTLTPKTLMAATKYSKQLLRQSTIDVENFVRNDIARVYALALDLAVLAGTGANNQPTGILTHTSVNTFTLGTNGAAPTFANVARMVKEIETDNADIAAQAYATTPGVKYKLATTQDFTSNGNPIWTGGPEGRVFGYPAYSTNQIPSNLTQGTSTTVCSAIIFGSFSEAVLGEWGSMELTVDPYTLAGYGMIAVTSFGMFDVALKHPEAFCTVKDALTT